MRPPIPGLRFKEEIYSSFRSIVFRAVRETDSQVVIVKTINKEFPSPKEVARLRWEGEVLTRLAHCSGISHLLDVVRYRNNYALILEDAQGASIFQGLAAAGPMDLKRFFSVAARLLETLQEIHDVNVIHKDINPSNILWNPSLDNVVLVDFGMSSILAQESLNNHDFGTLEGSLTFISPEQTGRMNRQVDYRSDYYSLGVTFYQMVCGQLPFQGTSSLEWIQLHLSQEPSSARVFRPDVPILLDGLIAKLLSKNPEDRYQSIEGILYDLKAIAASWSTGFESLRTLGTKDRLKTLSLSKRFWGREAELLELSQAVHRTLEGEVGAVFVSGDPGTGKSEIVREMQQAVLRKRGFFLEGKFDQLNSDRSDGALIQALDGLVVDLLSESESVRDTWKEKITQTLGENLSIIVDFVPAMRALYPTVDSVEELNPLESRNRFFLTVRLFFQVFATPENPVVLFLDDLQWSDTSILDLLTDLLGNESTHAFLLIGAFRPDEVPMTHPLTAFLRRFEDRTFVHLRLKNLPESVIGKMVADLLLRDPQDLPAIVPEIYKITDGNPLFLLEFFRYLHETNQLIFLPEKGFWDVPTYQVLSTGLAPTVLDFMLQRAKRLAQPTQDALSIAAAIGGRFELGALAKVLSTTQGAAANVLWPALEATMLVPIEGRLLSSQDKDDISGRPGETGSFYRFVHDRIQQAAYETLSPSKRQEIHLKIARALTPPDAQSLENLATTLARQYNRASALITLEGDRWAAIKTNLEASRQAKTSAAYSSSFEFAEAAWNFLPEDLWITDYSLAFSVTKEYSASAFLAGNLALGEKLCHDLIHRARNTGEKVEVLKMELVQYAFNGKMNEALEVGCKALRYLGLRVSPRPGMGALLGALAEVKFLLLGKKPRKLLSLRTLTNEKSRTILQILFEFIAPSYLQGNSNLFGIIVLKQVAISLKEGLSPESATAFINYSALLAALGDLKGARDFSGLAMNLHTRFQDKSSTGRFLTMYGLFSSAWNQPWKELSSYFQNAVTAGLQSGDFLFASFAAGYVNLWAPDIDLTTAIKATEPYLALVEKTQYSNAMHAIALHQQFRLALNGQTESPASLDTSTFQEAQCVESMNELNYVSGLAIHGIVKLKLFYFQGDYCAAWDTLQQTDAFITALAGSPYLIEYRFFACLTAFELAVEPSIKGRALIRAQKELTFLKRWYKHFPEGFALYLFIAQGVSASVSNRLFEAQRSLTRASELASRLGYSLYQGLADELIGTILCHHEQAHSGSLFLIRARRNYWRYGAITKTRQLEERWGDLVSLENDSAFLEKISETFMQTTRNEESTLDFPSLLRASHAITSEVFLDAMLEKLMPVLLEHSGAQRAVLLRRDNQRFYVESEIHEKNEVQIFDKLWLDHYENLPHSVIRLVSRTQEAVFFTDLSTETAYRDDPYLQTRTVGSVFCAPLNNKGAFSGILYLENNLIKGLFTPDWVKFFQLLLAQTAISLENTFFSSQLTAKNVELADANKKLEEKNEAFRRFVPVQFLQTLHHSPEDPGVQSGEWIEQEATVLFAGLRNFMGLSETMRPDETLKFVNSYLSRMVPIIEAHAGMVDKIIGDTIMALFVNPKDAVEASIKMLQHLRVYNGHRAQYQYPPLDIGIGLNTGQVLLGTLGYSRRLQTAAIGDTVNLASRTEELTKEWKAPLLITESTWKALKGSAIGSRYLGTSTVKGKDLKVHIYEVYEHGDRIPFSQKDLENRFHKVVRAMEASEWSKARESLDSWVQDYPDDTVAAALFLRIKMGITTSGRGWF